MTPERYLLRQVLRQALYDATKFAVDFFLLFLLVILSMFASRAWGGPADVGYQGMLAGAPVKVEAGPAEVAQRGGQGTTTTVPPTTSTVPVTTTIVSTTSPSSTTTTTTVPWPVTDDFNRAGPALGANWTTPLTAYPIAPIITGNAATAQVGTVGVAVYNRAQPQNDSYAAGQVLWTTGDTGSMVGACLTVPAAQDAACCILNQGWLSFQVADNGGSLTEQNRNASSFSSGDWVGIVRTGAQGFQCYSSKDGTTWTARGTAQTVTTMATGGQPGFTATSNAKTLDVWKAGLGPINIATALPAELPPP